MNVNCPGSEVSLITTTYNEGDNIEAFLDSYKMQTRHADEFIIVDGGSSDDTAKNIADYAEKNRHLNIRLLVRQDCSRAHTQGPIARGRNVAVNEASHDIIAVTDAGCQLDRSWLEEITKPFEDETVGVVSGWYTAIPANGFQEAFIAAAMPKLEKTDKDNFLPSSRSIAFRKRCWSEVGGYPETTYTAEDTKFDMALREAGFRFFFAEKALVYWKCPVSLGDAFRKYHRYGQGDGESRILKGEALAHFISLVVPLRFMVDRQLHFKKYFWLRYALNAAYVSGYLRGLLSPAGPDQGGGQREGMRIR